MVLVRTIDAFDTDGRRPAQANPVVSCADAQRYVLREPLVVCDATKDEDTLHDLAIREQPLGSRPTEAPGTEVNRLGRNGVAGGPLLDALSPIHVAHGLRDAPVRRLADRSE